MLLLRPLSKVGKHLKLLMKDDLDTFREHVRVKLEESEQVLVDIKNQAETDKEKVTPQSLIETAENDVLLAYDVIDKIDTLLEKMEAMELAEEEKAQKKEKSKINKLLRG
jgi:hypothetical protein